MKKSILIGLCFLIGLAALADAKIINVLIYCKGRPSEIVGEIKEHWKDELPDLGAGQVIRDHVLLAKQGQKRFYHALVERSDDNTKQFNAIKNYAKDANGCTEPGVIWSVECTTPLSDQILFWNGATAEDAYKSLWQDRSLDPLIETIAKGILRYRVDTTCDGEPCKRTVSVQEAEDTYGVTIDPQQILIPHKFYGR